MSTSTDELPPAAKEAEPDAGEFAKEVSDQVERRLESEADQDSHLDSQKEAAGMDALPTAT